MIVGLSGYARSGKDTVGEILTRHHGYHRVSFAHRLKVMAEALDPVLAIQIRGEDPITTVPEVYTSHQRLSSVLEVCEGWERAKAEVPETREFLQRLGVAARDHLGPNVWVDAALAHLDEADDIVVTDVRFPNEAEAIRSRGGIVLRVERPGTGPVNGHVSEHALDDYAFDYRIANDGSIADLEAEVARTLGYLNVEGVRHAG